MLARWVVCRLISCTVCNCVWLIVSVWSFERFIVRCFLVVLVVDLRILRLVLVLVDIRINVLVLG